MDAKGVLEFAKKHNAKILDLRFIDVPGIWQHVSYPIHNFDEKSFEDGFGMDASSIRGWAQIHESDMLLIPDANTAFMDPFRDTPTLVMSRRRRRSAHQAALSARSPLHRAQSRKLSCHLTGIADQAFFGAEAEFFIFDNVRFDQQAQTRLLLHRFR